MRHQLEQRSVSEPVIIPNGEQSASTETFLREELIVAGERFERLLGQPRLKGDRLSASDYKLSLPSDSVLNKYRGAYFTVVSGEIQNFLSIIEKSKYIKIESINQAVRNLESFYGKVFREYKHNRVEQRKLHLADLKADVEFVSLVAHAFGKTVETLTDSDWNELTQSILKTADNRLFPGQISEKDFAKIVEKFNSVTKKHLNTLDEEIDQMDMLLVDAKDLANEIRLLEVDEDAVNYQKPNNKFDQPYAR